MIRQCILALGLLFLIAFNAKARTYIQCAGTANDRVVVNLNGNASTLFMTTGVGDPDEVRVLKNIRELRSSEKFVEYVTTDDEILVTVPRKAVGSIINGFEVILSFVDSDYDYSLSCFSNVFED